MVLTVEAREVSIGLKRSRGILIGKCTQQCKTLRKLPKISEIKKRPEKKEKEMRCNVSYEWLYLFFEHKTIFQYQK